MDRVKISVLFFSHELYEKNHDLGYKFTNLVTDRPFGLTTTCFDHSPIILIATSS